METTIISRVDEYLDDELIAQLSSAIGGTSQQVQQALAGAIPALLTCFSESAETSQTVYRAVIHQDERILNGLGFLLSGSSTQKFKSQGTGILSSLIGNNKIVLIVEAISELSGISKGAATALVGYLTPILLGLLKRELSSRGAPSADRLTTMLANQKYAIKAAHPGNFNYTEKKKASTVARVLFGFAVLSIIAVAVVLGSKFLA